MSLRPQEEEEARTVVQGPVSVPVQPAPAVGGLPGIFFGHTQGIKATTEALEEFDFEHDSLEEYVLVHLQDGPGGETETFAVPLDTDAPYLYEGAKEALGKGKERAGKIAKKGAKVVKRAARGGLTKQQLSKGLFVTAHRKDNRDKDGKFTYVDVIVDSDNWKGTSLGKFMTQTGRQWVEASTFRISSPFYIHYNKDLNDGTEVGLGWSVEVQAYAQAMSGFQGIPGPRFWVPSTFPLTGSTGSIIFTYPEAAAQDPSFVPNPGMPTAYWAKWPFTAVETGGFYEHKLANSLIFVLSAMRSSSLENFRRFLKAKHYDHSFAGGFDTGS